MPSFLTGSVCLEVHGVRPEALFNRIRNTVPIGSFVKLSDDACRLNVDDNSVSTVTSTVRRLGGKTRIASRFGLPWLLFRFLRRPGLLAGTLLSLFAIFFTRTLIWEVRVEGCERIQKHELFRTMQSAGIAEGRRQNKAQLDEAVRNIILTDGRIAWMSINYDGTVAHVVLDERDNPPTDETICDYITASRDGVLLRLDVLSGGAEAKNGDAVTRGQLLISSFKPSREAGTLYDRARGFAWALTRHTVSVTMKKQTVRRVYSDTVTRSRTLLILGTAIPLTPLVPSPSAPYTRTTSTVRATLFGRIPLPFRIKTVTRQPYTLEPVNLMPEDAHSLADASLDRRIASFPDGTQILSQTESFCETDEEYTFTYTLECVENIAEMHGDN